MKSGKLIILNFNRYHYAVFTSDNDGFVSPEKLCATRNLPKQLNDHENKLLHFKLSSKWCLNAETT